MLAVSATRVVVNAANTARTQRVKRKGAGKVRLERVSNASRRVAARRRIHSFILSGARRVVSPTTAGSIARGDESRAR